MAVDKYTVEIVDSEGNSSRLVLPGFALDSTQEKLIKSVQALGKLNPKMAKAYEDLLDATNEAAKSGNSATEKQTEELEKVLTVTSEKQVKALKTFREAFADRVGKDMRDTFVAGGNILTAAIKTVTVGLAAGAGLLYKTFMDTSEAFRTLAQSGLGSAGPSGREAQDAVSNLVQLGMSASEAASMLTSFGRASAVLGKANFSKFVSGIAGAGSFAADLGLTLNDAAEFTAKEVELRQAAMSSRLLLDTFEQASVKENIRLTQAMATVFGRSMKDIQASKEDFMRNNAQLATLMLRLPAELQQKVSQEVSNALTIAGGFSGDIENVMKIFLNSASSAIPIADSTVQQLLSLGPAARGFINEINQLNGELSSGSINARQSMLRLVDTLARNGKSNARLLSILEQSGDPVAAMIARAARDAAVGGEQLRQALLGIQPAMDPVIAAGTRLENTLSQVQGSLRNFGLQVTGGLAGPLDSFMRALTDTGLTEDQQKEIDKNIKQWEKNNKVQSNWSDERIKQWEDERQQYIDQQYAVRNATTVMSVLSSALNDIGRTFMQVFFGDINPTVEDFGKKLRNDLIPWIRQTAEDLKQWLRSLEGKTFGEKLKSLLSGIIKEGAKLVLQGIGAALWEVLTSPTAIATLLAGFTGLFALSIVKTAVASAIATGLTPAIVSLGASLTGLTASVATASRNIVAASLTGIGNMKGLLAFGLRALPVLGGAAMVGKDAMDIAGGKDEANKGSNWGGVIGGVLGAAAGGVLAVSTLGLGTPAAIAMAGGGAMLGNMIGDWVGGWFDSPEGEETQDQMSDQMQQSLVEGQAEALRQQGLALANATDPQHVRNVALAMERFNQVDTTNITSGLNTLNPAIADLFQNIQNVKTAFVDVVSKRIETLVNVLTRLNIEGFKLPTTTEHLTNLANQIISTPLEPIKLLATVFSALTTALKDFGDLTTSNRFGRMWDGFLDKEDTTKDVIKVLNDFARGIDDPDKLLRAAEATQAYNAAMAGYARPTDVQRTNVTDTQTQAPTANTTASQPQMEIGDNENTRLLRRIELILNRAETKLSQIKDNTDPTRAR